MRGLESQSKKTLLSGVIIMLCIAQVGFGQLLETYLPAKFCSSLNQTPEAEVIWFI